jgi:thiamine-phosphate diphosphorylase
VRPHLPRLHAVTDERVARRSDLEEVARELATAGGARLALHARGRALSGLEHCELSFRLSVFPSPLFVNDRLDIALAAGARGVQLGHGSLPSSSARQLDREWWIGKSVHDLGEAEAAKAEGADYLFVGPVYATTSHADRPIPPLGLDGLRAIVRLVRDLPVIAIGGVTPERAGAVRASGAYGAAAIRALWDAGEPGAAAARMLKELES